MTYDLKHIVVSEFHKRSVPREKTNSILSFQMRKYCDCEFCGVQIRGRLDPKYLKTPKHFNEGSLPARRLQLKIHNR